MEVTYISGNSIRIKGKQASFVVNPTGGKKSTPSDAALLIGEKQTDFFTQNNGVVFQGPGEYEVKGVKLTGFSAGEQTLFTLTVDDLAVLVGNVSATLLAKEKLHEHDVAILIADDTLNQGVMGVLNVRVLGFVGEKAEENAKAFGKEFVPTAKYSVTKDKLPSETEFVFLG